MNQKGVSIIAVIATMLILAVMGVTLISLVTTGSDVSINQLQSEQAFNLAEGGIEYTLARNKSNIPNYSMQGATAPLGTGNFTVSTPAYLTAAIAVGNTTVNVNSTGGFAAAPGRIVIDSQVMAYTSMTANSFTIAPGATAAHANGNSVYPVTTLTADPGAGGTTLNVGSTTGFIVPGSVKIDKEYLYCTGSTAVTFTGCIRGYRNTSPAAHPIGRNVFQYIISSTATAGTAQRIIRANVDSTGAITYFGSASNPVDNGTLGTSPAVVTPPASMVTGDLVIVIANTRTAGITPAISATGGQAWTSETAITTNGSMRLFWCRYNGTWTASPSVSFSTSVNTTVVMHVFRSTTGTNTWALDVAQTTGTFPIPLAPRDVTITGITTVTNGALALFIWSSQDNNRWGIAGFTNAGGVQYRNTASTDSSQSAAYQIIAAAGATGNVTNREVTTGGGGNDQGNTISIAFKEVAAVPAVIDRQELY